MQDIDQVLRQQGGQGLLRLIDLADAAQPVEPDLDEVRRQLKEELQWVLKEGQRVKPKATAKNLETILGRDPEFAQGLWFNTFSQEVRYGDRLYKDSDSTTIRIRVGDLYGWEPTKALTDEVALTVASKHGRNPLQDWLRGIRWDGKKRIDNFLTQALGVEDGVLNRKLSRCFFIQLVARALEPGCKADTVLVLVGQKQGTKKSTALETIAGKEYFSDSPLEIGNRRAFVQMQKVWLYEFAEFDSVARSETSSVKAFLTSKTDDYVPPYGRFSMSVPRHTLFCGTVNHVEFLKDSTGNRRFWPVTIGAIDIPFIAENRSQLLGEAVAAFMSGEQWWLPEGAEDAMQERTSEHLHQDPWTPQVLSWVKVSGGKSFSIPQVMRECLKIDAGFMTRASEMRIAELLRANGFEKHRSRQDDGRLIYVWTSKDRVVQLKQPTGGRGG
jgi:predicted P-loop ATPase